MAATLTCPARLAQCRGGECYTVCAPGLGDTGGKSAPMAAITSQRQARLLPSLERSDPARPRYNRERERERERDYNLTRLAIMDTVGRRAGVQRAACNTQPADLTCPCRATEVRTEGEAGDTPVSSVTAVSTAAPA